MSGQLSNHSILRFQCLHQQPKSPTPRRSARKDTSAAQWRPRSHSWSAAWLRSVMLLRRRAYPVMAPYLLSFQMQGRAVPNPVVLHLPSHSWCAASLRSDMLLRRGLRRARYPSMVPPPPRFQCLHQEPKPPTPRRSARKDTSAVQWGLRNHSWSAAWLRSVMLLRRRAYPVMAPYLLSFQTQGRGVPNPVVLHLPSHSWCAASLRSDMLLPRGLRRTRQSRITMPCLRLRRQICPRSYRRAAGSFQV
ncbi:hypothetical protein EV363DRAFT_1346514 [Boletus edulis]|nr:hypothetical protein EV363DRAFT_1346514 [Boletus edulis]